MQIQLASNTWALSGGMIYYRAGILALKENKISFTTAKGEEFSMPLSAISNINWPRLQLGYGVHFDVGGKKYKFTFMQPSIKESFNTDENMGVNIMTNGASAIKTLSRAKEYKNIANEWKKVFENL